VEKIVSTIFLVIFNRKIAIFENKIIDEHELGCVVLYDEVSKYDSSD